jgi:hypothetical protein
MCSGNVPIKISSVRYKGLVRIIESLGGGSWVLDAKVIYNIMGSVPKQSPQ